MSEDLIPLEIIRQAILLVRGQKVMLDRDLALLYGVETRVLNQAVKRNHDRFPPDFMLKVTRDEILRISQFVISSPDLKYSKDAIRRLMSPPKPQKKQIGFQVREKHGKYRVFGKKSHARR